MCCTNYQARICKKLQHFSSCPHKPSWRRLMSTGGIGFPALKCKAIINWLLSLIKTGAVLLVLLGKSILIIIMFCNDIVLSKTVYFWDKHKKQDSVYFFACWFQLLNCSSYWLRLFHVWMNWSLADLTCQTPSISALTWYYCTDWLIHY